eukprot:2305183-Rhodomonas_salina.3
MCDSAHRTACWWQRTAVEEEEARGASAWLHSSESSAEDANDAHASSVQRSTKVRAQYCMLHTAYAIARA